MKNQHNISVVYLKQLLSNVNKIQSIKFINFLINKDYTANFVSISNKEKKILESIQITGNITKNV